eukprot:484673_1
MSTYTWKITDPSVVRSMKNAKNGAKWTSPMFSIDGFRWRLEVYPNGHRNRSKKNNSIGSAKLFLGLTFLPPKVKSVQIGKELRLIETDTKRISDSTYSKDDMCWGWKTKTLETEKLLNLTTLTFSVTIEVCGVIDNEDNDISNQYINTNNEESKHSALQSGNQSDQKLFEARLDSLINSLDKLVSNVQSLEQRVTDLEQRNNEEQKDNTNEKLDKLTEQMKLVKRDLRKLSTIAKTNPKQLELKSWLEMEVGFPQYYDTFMENGIEDLSIASMLTMETIKSIGIDKIGHQMKILRAVTKLNNKNRQQVNEGDTAYM